MKSLHMYRQIVFCRFIWIPIYVFNVPHEFFLVCLLFLSAQETPRDMEFYELELSSLPADFASTTES